MSQFIRIVDVNNFSCEDINELTRIYLLKTNLSPAKMVEMVQQKNAHKSARQAIQMIRKEHQYSIEKSSSEKKQKLDQLMEEAKSLLAHPRAINDPNPSYFLSINRLHEELKYAEHQVMNHQKSISKVMELESDLKSALRQLFRSSGNEADKEIVDKLLDEIGTKALLESLEKGEKKWQEQVSKIKLELAGLPIVTLYGQSNLENFQDNNHNKGDINDDIQ